MPDLLSKLPPRIHKILDEGAEQGASRIAFTDERGAEWSYRRLIDTVGRVAAEMNRLGVRSGDRVMIVCENSIAAIVLMYAASRLDAWAVMANARLSAHELDLIEQDCSPRRIFFTNAVSPEADAHAERRGASAHLFTGIGEVKLGELHPDAVPERTYADPARQAAILIYTTGTTGRPKGVMLSHRSLAFVAARGKRTSTILASDVSLCLMPISHSYGLTTMQGALFAGAHLRIMPRFSLTQTIELIRNGTLTLFSAVPALYARLVTHADQTGTPLSPNKLRYAYTGTAPLDLPLRRNVERVLGVTLHNGYGLTETSPTISRTSYEMGSDEINIGPPIPGIEIRIVGADGREIHDGSPGELHVRGPNVMLGYYRQPELTQSVIDADGFLNTGDIVSRAPGGELVVQGRTKELIIRSGFNVYPPEIEAVLNSHPSVLNSAVVGRAIEGDEEIIAFVEPVPGSSIEIRELLSLIESRLARYKKPQQIIVMPQLPVAPNGKIRKNELKRHAENCPKPSDVDFGQNSHPAQAIR
jgi:acyl-CoA synthetase (AMP-forming)/AMP-acid ligase II